MSISGEEIPIPSATDDYLEYRYGKWKVPNPEWVYWRDDKALKPEPPNNFNVW
jgi:hypothetical protein